MHSRILAIDVHYQADKATAAGVCFDDWTASSVTKEVVVELDHIAEYQPGEFYRRELPCLLAVLERLDNPPCVIVIDGYVWLDANLHPGLGGRLFDSLNGQIPVVGVAKTRFIGAPAVEILRGRSRTPLFITAAGADATAVADSVKSMAGPDRLPLMLKRVDHLSRGIG